MPNDGCVPGVQSAERTPRTPQVDIANSTIAMSIRAVTGPSGVVSMKSWTHEPDPAVGSAWREAATVRDGTL